MLDTLIQQEKGTKNTWLLYLLKNMKSRLGHSRIYRLEYKHKVLV